MSKKYQEYISDICIEYDTKLHFCPLGECNNAKKRKLGQIENDIADLSHINEEQLEEYDQEEEETVICECDNEIVFTYNPYKIILKYF